MEIGPKEDIGHALRVFGGGSPRPDELDDERAQSVNGNKDGLRHDLVLQGPLTEMVTRAGLTLAMRYHSPMSSEDAHAANELQVRDASSQSQKLPGSPFEVLKVATRLGCTSFGGPIAHIGYFQTEYVDRRRWVDDSEFADLVALSQFLPGPASSKLGISIGILRAGLWGGIAAWVGFTLPSAALMVLFAYGSRNLGAGADGFIHGLKVVAVAVVALAVWSMAKTLAFDRLRGTIALAAAILLLSWPGGIAQVLAIVGGGTVGWFLLREDVGEVRPPPFVPIGRRAAVVAWTLMLSLLIALPIARHSVNSQPLNIVDGFYRSGSLVFGGGHVVLPLLQAEVVPPGWVSNQEFLAGYGAAQAVPGPLFTFAAYLGAVMEPEPNGIPGAALALVAIFLPAFLLTIGVLPLWGAVRGNAGAQAVLRGVNAAVVGILLAALYTPVATSAILEPLDFALALAAFGALGLWKLPPWLVVVLTACGGALIAKIG
jgi:chromate transporter